MSQSSMSEITCPACGSKHEFKVWDSINTKQDLELKEAVRTGDAFRYTCPDCGATALLNYNFLYHQMEDKYMVFVSVEGDAWNQMMSILSARQKDLPDYTMRIVRSYNDFREKLMILDAGLDDRVVEIIKSSVWHNVEETYADKGIDEILFAMNDDGEHGFLFRSKDKMIASMEFDMDLYKVVKNAAESRLDFYSRGIFGIDRAWADRVVGEMG